MPQPHAGALSATAAAERQRSQKRTFWHHCRRAGRRARKLPSFIYILVIYIIMMSTVQDMRESFYSIATYSIAWVEVLYLLAFLAAITELRRVVRPGDDNTDAALAMTFVAVAYIVLFSLGAAGIPLLTMFATSEFIVLILVSIIQVIMAFRVNSATLQRTIGSTEAGGHYDNDHWDD